MLAKPKPVGKSLLIALTPTKEMTKSWANKTIKSCIEPTETHHSQTNKQKQDNRQRSSVRYIVERTFGLLKLHHGLGKARYLGLERNKTRANWLPWVIILKQGWIFLNRCENCRIVASNGWNKGKNRREIAKKCKQSVLFLGFEESENNFEKLQKLGLKQ